jgi:hypothetical protein
MEGRPAVTSTASKMTVVDRILCRVRSAFLPTTEPRFVIVGTGRSGSGYISHLLTACGIRCGHESWWNPHGRRERGLVGDSSWCALALVDWDTYRGHIFHQVRHPLDVIASYVHRQSFTSPFAKIKLPLLREDPAGDPLRYGCRIWLDLNRRSSELTKACWRVEDVDADVVRMIGRTVGIVPRNVEAALRSVSTTTNSHGTQRRLRWEDLPGDLVDEIEALAFEYGYERKERKSQVFGADGAMQCRQRRSA